jgi:hypothetical protein
MPLESEGDFVLEDRYEVTNFILWKLDNFHTFLHGVDQLY